MKLDLNAYILSYINMAIKLLKWLHRQNMQKIHIKLQISVTKEMQNFIFR